MESKGVWSFPSHKVGRPKRLVVLCGCTRGSDSMQPPPIHQIRDRLLQGLDKDYNVNALPPQITICQFHESTCRLKSAALEKWEQKQNGGHFVKCGWSVVQSVLELLGVVKRVSRGALLSTAGTRGQAWPALRSSKGRPHPLQTHSCRSTATTTTRESSTAQSQPLPWIMIASSLQMPALAWLGLPLRNLGWRAVVDLLDTRRPTLQLGYNSFNCA